MASPCEVHLAGADRAVADRVLEAVAAEAWRIEHKYSRYLPGNIVHSINNANGEPVVVDEETAGLLTYADRLHALSEGRFDITSGVLRRAWRFDGGSRLPDIKAVRRLMNNVGWRRARWRAPELRLRPGMEIDFGGIGKEYAVDRAGAIASRTWPNCLINFGGDLLATGLGIDAGGWTVGIENTHEGQSQRLIRLLKGGVATSGDARRYLIKDGKRYGHILDPTTGWPVEGSPRSVTVVAPTCTQAGMLATFAMLQGADADAFLRAQDIEAYYLS
jgi:thiamine biosynthesis lipoprotein